MTSTRSSRWATATSPTSVALADGRRFTLRGATSSDLAEVQALHARCSPSTLSTRYFANGRAPGRRLTTALLSTDLALVATSPTGALAALGNLAPPDEDADVAELAALVQDDWQDTPLGVAVVHQLVGGARLLGYREVVSIAAADRSWVQECLSRLGETLLQRTPFGEAVLRLELAPHHVGLLGPPAPESPRRVVVSRPGVA